MGELEEYLAEKFINNSKNPFAMSITKNDDHGYLDVVDNIIFQSDFVSGGEIDFELSPCECVDFDQMNIEDYKNKTIHTGSAVELFEFLFMFYDSVNCLIDFEGTAWRVIIE